MQRNTQKYWKYVCRNDRVFLAFYEVAQGGPRGGDTRMDCRQFQY